MEEGPFNKGLDGALKSFHVQREAYYGGTFVGNHVHRYLKVYMYYNTNVHVNQFTFTNFKLNSFNINTTFIKKCGTYRIFFSSA